MFYRLKRNLRYFKFHQQIRQLLDTPPIEVRDAPHTIVSMVAGYDTRMYILAIKALYHRIGRGNIVVIPDRMSSASMDLIRRHVRGVAFVPLETINTGHLQKGGTWERLIYCVERSAAEYVIQMDADILCVGPIPEVLEAINTNTAFNLADGIPKKPLNQWVEDAAARKSDNVVFAFEKTAPGYPHAEKLMYLRGSSGFAGFAQGAVNREFLEDFYDKSLALLGPRWSEWGTEQIASNFCIANSPGSFGLPVPRFLTWENHPVSSETSLYHFLGYCRFDQGLLARLANQEIDRMLNGAEKAT
jgi:hypothetical protein